MEKDTEIMSRSERISLGMDIMLATYPKGSRHSHAEIAAYCDCTRAAIQKMESRLLAKLHKRIATTAFRLGILSSTERNTISVGIS